MRGAESEGAPQDGVLGGGVPEDVGDEPPAEFPERWTKFLPPGEVRARLLPRRRKP